jgi:hypothetical protein
LVTEIKQINFYFAFWGTTCFWGGRFSQNEGQGNTQQITRFKPNTELRASSHQRSCVTCAAIKNFYFEISFVDFKNLYYLCFLFLTLLCQNQV